MSSSGSAEEGGNNVLNVYCRVRPLASPEAQSWLSVVNRSSLVISQTSGKQTVFKFQQVFSSDSTQKKVFTDVALPLVEHALHGHNALLFTYGNTGSGKTYTMKGTFQEGGILPRCLDVIFNSISSNLAQKNLFKPDRFNGFDLQSEKEAISDSNRALLKHITYSKTVKSRIPKKHNSDPDLVERLIDSTQVVSVNKFNTYAVFISFIEIYNNAVYDLLEDNLEDNLHPKPPQCKVIREDNRKNMYVHGATEIEVSSTEEAYEIFYAGVKRRRVAQTLLNAQSSRSHSAFTVRIVQTECSASGGSGSNKQSQILVGQLSLVDLAGSERTNRTQNTGKGLKEAGNINNSLMNLRLCFEALRENQNGGNRVVPYRENKLTTLFKNYFEGDGYISMIICINPHKDDFEESMHVLKFAENSQEVKFNIGAMKQMEIEEANSRQKILEHVSEFDEMVKKIQENKTQPRHLPFIEFPREVSWKDMHASGLPDFLNTMEETIDSMLTQSAPSVRSLNFERDITSFMRNSLIKCYEAENVKSSLMAEREKQYNLQLEANSLKRKLEESNNQVKRLKKELSEVEKTVMKTKAEKDREKEKFQIKRNVYKEKYNSELERRLKRQRTELEMEIQNKEEKLARVKRVLSDEAVSTCSTPSVASCRAKFERIATTPSVPSTPLRPNTDIRPTIRRPQVAVSNRRHRRSRSAGEVWLEHRPAMAVPLNTVLQPSIPKRRSVTKLTDAKQVTQGPSHYCLVTQTHDSDGDLETRLYKGDVIPTAGGGAQVLFNDVEVLKQESPEASPKSHLRGHVPQDTPSCSYAIEGHRLRSHRKH